MKNKKKRRNKYQTPAETVKKAEASEVQMPVPDEKRQVEETPIEDIKTQVQDELNNNELTPVPEELNISIEVVAVDEVVEKPKPIAEEESKTEPSILEADEVIKHPLEHTWGFWLYTNESKNWADNIKQLTLFDTVEDYWCLYHHTKLPSELVSGQDYAIFKSGIRPMWEDPANRPGGRWFINLEQKFKVMDRVWVDLVLLMIGENFVNTDLICGAVVNVRTKKPNKISLWTRSKRDVDVVPIGRQIKQMLQIHMKLQFLDHKNTCLFFI